MIRSLTTVQSVVNREIEYAIKHTRPMAGMLGVACVPESLQEDSNQITPSALGMLASQCMLAMDSSPPSKKGK